MSAALPADYWEHVYAGVLGKVIGVYLGRPFEGAPYEWIQQRLGDVEYYVHDRLDAPLIVTDDDISGTFTFIRALADHANRPDISSREIGDTWLNYLIERRTVLWWGGLGHATSNTAYLRLAAGIEAPASGSATLNGEMIASEIDAQIFIDGWAMVAPGDPALAASLAERAARVANDGVAIDAARCLAAMESVAFVESDIGRIIETGRSFVSDESRLAELVDALVELRRTEPDWRVARAWLAREHGYKRYGGNVPIVPNHGLIMLSLLYGDGDIDRTLSIVSTCGWDTDCNTGNVGCLMGIRGGLAGFDRARHDWRGPVADRMFLPSADGGRAITDALTESVHLVNSGRALNGMPPIAPKHGARFHFELSGAVQGFAVSGADGVTGALENVAHHSDLGERALALSWDVADGTGDGHSVRAGTPTFLRMDQLHMNTYELLASPTLHSGQRMWARLSAEQGRDAAEPPRARIYVMAYGEGDVLSQVSGPEVALDQARTDLEWLVPDVGGGPIAEAGVEILPARPGHGRVFLDALGWTGAPSTTFRRPEYKATMWRRAWVDAVDQWDASWGPAFRVIQNRGRGLIAQGTNDWQDYRVAATLTPQLCQAGGLAARIRGLRHYYALMVERGGGLVLERYSGTLAHLARRDYDWHLGEPHEFALELIGSNVKAYVDGRLEFEVDDTASGLRAGGVGMVVVEGRVDADAISVQPIDQS